MRDERSIQQPEYITDSKSQYLVIHKCGNSSVRDAMGQPGMIHIPLSDRVIFTVIRDPVERFISGFIYDLFNSYVVTDNMQLSEIEYTVVNHIKNNDIYNVYHYIDPYKKNRLGARNSGSISHTIPQLSYIVNQPIQWFVDIKDLSTFLQLHYNTDVKKNVSNVNIEVKDLISSILLKRKQRILDIHSADYYFIERIRENGLFWDWQNGKIF